MSPDSFRAQLEQLDPGDDQYATRVVDLVLALGGSEGVSDIHLLPTSQALEVRWRLDGVLAPLGPIPRELAANVIARLKVLAGLLTYRTDVPQEGRLLAATDAARAESTTPESTTPKSNAPDADVRLADMRLATCPTVHGEKAVVRLFPLVARHAQLDGLGYAPDIAAWLAQTIRSASGAVLICGPAGSGKTTTLYAALRQIVAGDPPLRSVVSLEDPVELPIDGVAQTQTGGTSDIDMASGLKYLLRQDPEVIMVGEIRDSDTARVAFQAALTGHLVLSSFHAGSAAEAVVRLGDMGVDGYLLRSGLSGIICQRLLRRLCRCAKPLTDSDDLLGLEVSAAHGPVGCKACRGSGYHGRMLLAELFEADAAVLAERDAPLIEHLAAEKGMTNRWQRARQAVEAGATSPAEVRRTLGFGE